MSSTYFLYIYVFIYLLQLSIYQSSHNKWPLITVRKAVISPQYVVWSLKVTTTCKMSAWNILQLARRVQLLFTVSLGKTNCACVSTFFRGSYEAPSCQRASPLIMPELLPSAENVGAQNPGGVVNPVIISTTNSDPPYLMYWNVAGKQSRTKCL